MIRDWPLALHWGQWLRAQQHIGSANRGLAPLRVSCLCLTPSYRLRTSIRASLVYSSGLQDLATYAVIYCRPTSTPSEVECSLFPATVHALILSAFAQQAPCTISSRFCLRLQPVPRCLNSAALQAATAGIRHDSTCVCLWSALSLHYCAFRPCCSHLSLVCWLHSWLCD